MKELDEEQTCTIDPEATKVPMDFREYQRAAYRTIKPHATVEMEKADWGLGIGGEAGEVQELIKHDIMHKHDMDVAKLAKEVGDVLWYCAAICQVYGINLHVAAELNIAKLNHRHGETYSKDGSAERHQKEEKFSDTEIYKKLVARLKR